MDVSLNEGPAQEFKLTTEQGAGEAFCFFLPDGSSIDLEFWSGGDDDDICFFITDALGDTVLQSENFITGAPIPTVKTDCPECCTDASSTHTVRVTLGANPEFLSWEIYDGSPFNQGPQVVADNGNSFAGLPPGTQITCLLYTSPSPRDATLSRMPSSA